MFDSNSRYFGIEIATHEAPGRDGRPRELRYVRRRFVPPPVAGEAPIEHVVAQGDRLDNLAARYLGEPTRFWQLCDDNGAVRPDELTEEPGRALKITLPEL